MTQLSVVLASDIGGWFCLIIGVLAIIGVISKNSSEETSSGGRRYVPHESVPDFTVKCEKDFVGTGTDREEAWKIYCQGRVPVLSQQDVTLIVTLQDKTNAEARPVTCMIGQLRDADTGAYRDSLGIGECNPGTYLKSWVCVAIMPVNHMAAAYSGMRKLQVSCTAVPSYISNKSLGSHLLWDSAICSAQTIVEVSFPMTGYLEANEKARDARALIVEVAMACALADGSIDQRELRVINRWMKSVVTQMEQEESSDVEMTRSSLNDALKKGSAGLVRLDSACRSLKQCGLPSMNQVALSLCVDVISADGVLNENELMSVRKIALALNIDYARLQSLLDKHFKSGSITVADDNLEGLVGVDPTWDREKIRRHLADQFMKWNARAPNAKTTNDQTRIRSMLDAIAKLKKKYS
jgi:tellurite resistance protein